MGIKFQSPLELSAHRTIAHNNAAQTLTVTVVSKTAAHPEYGNGSSNGYAINGIEGAYIELTPGNTYRFDQSNSSNSGHPFRFYEDAAKTTAYTTGVTTNGTPGTSGAYTQIIPTTSTPPILFYQCSAHSLMGSYVKFGTGSQGDTYTLSATQDGSNVDILLDAGSGTDSTVQLTAGSNITLTRNNAQEVTIASTASGGGGAELNIERNVFTATANQTAFTISTAITASSNTQVYIDGVYQAKSNYTTSGSVVTFSTGVPLGSEVEVVHFIAVYSKIYTDTFTGNGSTTQYTTSKDVSDENETQIYIDGVYQSKDNYTTSGTTVTFSTAPPNGTAIEVVHFDAAEYTSLASNQFTGTGSQTAFTLTQSNVDEDSSFVFIQGVYQEKSTYSISGSTLTFTTAPINGYTIEVITAGVVANVTSSPVTSVNGQTGAVTVETGTDWNTSIKTADFTAVAGEGYFVDVSSSAITVTLPSSPSVGDEVTIVDYKGNSATNNITITSSNDINNSSSNKFINYNYGSIQIVYSSSSEGWVAFSAANETASALASIPLTVNYLVVAGGGGGNHANGGGGGAGGLRTSYTNSSGLAGHTESALTLNAATNYTVTVGAGGSGVQASGTFGVNYTLNNGNNSVFSSITSIGGGAGGVRTTDSNASGQDGGSGGGGGSYHSAGNQKGEAVTSPVVHGYDGADGVDGGNYQGGGGGGAGAAGTVPNGGVGLAVNILNATNAGTASVGEVSGSDVFYAGGGGAGANSSAGSGGTGGGADGTSSFALNSGTDGTGGGGGSGAVSGTFSGGDGGDGVVIIRYPSQYTVTVGSGITEASSSPFTEGTSKVSVFTGGTGTIQFN